MALQKNQAAVKQNPKAWLPWNYHEQRQEKPPDMHSSSQQAA